MLPLAGGARSRRSALSGAATVLVVLVAGAHPSGQANSGVMELSPTRVPAEIRVSSDGWAVLLYREPFRGYAPSGASGVEVRTPAGAVQFERRPGLDVPDATIVTLLDAALSRGGHVVVSMVTARPGAGTAHVLAYYSSDASVVRLVRTEVACFRVIPAADEGVWCLGPHVARHNSGDTDFRFLHHFSEDGRLRRSVAHRTAFHGAPGPWDGRSQLTRTSDGLVVWMAARRELALFDTDGRVLARQAVPVPPVVADPRTDFVLGSDGELYALGITQQPTAALASWRRDLFRFSPATSTWTAAGIGNLSLAVRLVGASDALVTLWDRPAARLLRVGR